MLSPGLVKASVQKLSAGTIPGLKHIQSFSILHWFRIFDHSIMEEKYSGGRKEYPRISCLSRSERALIMNSGELKSISATHIGITSAEPKVSLLKSYLMQLVPSLRAGSSKFHFIKNGVYFRGSKINKKHTGYYPYLLIKVIR